MVSTELHVQSGIIATANQRGGYGLKMSNRFQAGVPDLLLSMPKFGSAIVETKLLKPGQRTADLTPLQRLTLTKMRLSGIKCGWAAIRIDGPGQATIYMSVNPEAKTVNEVGVFEIRKAKGEPWPVERIISFMQ